MAYFKSKGIILKKTKHGEKQCIYSIFSYDYGRIDVIKKISAKEKPLDVGYDINFEIHSKKNTNISRIANIKIINEFDVKEKDFETIHDFLSFLSVIYTRTEKSHAIYEIYILLNALLKIDITKEKILLARLKFLQILGELDEQHTDFTIQKILNFLQKNPSSKVLRLAGIEGPIYRKLQEVLKNY